MLSRWSVDVTNAAVPSRSLERLGEQARVGERVLYNSPVARESQMHEAVVLGDDLSNRV